MAKFISFFKLTPFPAQGTTHKLLTRILDIEPFTLSMSMTIGYDFKSPSDVLHVLPLTYTLDQTNKTVPNMTDISISVLHTLLDTLAIVLMRRNCLTINSFLAWRSIPLLQGPLKAVLFKEKLDADLS